MSELKPEATTYKEPLQIYHNLVEALKQTDVLIKARIDEPQMKKIASAQIACGNCLSEKITPILKDKKPTDLVLLGDLDEYYSLGITLNTLSKFFVDNIAKSLGIEE